MRIRVGYQDHDYGTIAATPDGFDLEGDRGQLDHALHIIAGDEDPADAPGGRPGYLRYMMGHMNNGYWWVRPDDDEARQVIGRAG